MLFGKKRYKYFLNAIKYMKNIWIKYLIFVMLNLIIITFEIVHPMIWGKIVLSLAEYDKKSLILYIFIFGGVLLISISLQFLTGVISNQLVNLVTKEIKIRMFKELHSFTTKIFDDVKLGELFSRLNNDANIVSSILINEMQRFIFVFVRCLVVAIICFSISPIMSVIVFIFLPISILIFLKSGVIIKKMSYSIKSETDCYNSKLLQHVAGIRELRVYGNKEDSVNAMRDGIEKVISLDNKLNILNHFSNSLASIMNVIMQISLLMLGGYFILLGELTLDYFIAYSGYATMLSKNFTLLASFNNTVQSAIVSIERVEHFLKHLGYKRDNVGEISINKVKSGIQFNNVSFSYNNDNEVLSNVTMRIPAMKKVAIIGLSGCGKSTIVNLIARLYSPVSGKILFDDVDILDINEESFREQLIIVQQNPYIFHDSILNNLRLSNSNASRMEIEDACVQAKIHDFIIALPQGYDTIIGEDGNKLSGGQRQRLAIAKALLSKCSIMIFDESTSALDTQTELELQTMLSLNNVNRTIIIVTHKLASVIDCDEIIYFDEGRVLCNGSHRELYSVNEKYKNLYETYVNSNLMNNVI
jgi:ABC-type multidrug transport system fused ATPase/permease subunit